MRLIDADALQSEYMKYHGGKRIVLVDVAPTIDPQPEWIPCTPETMPEEAGAYLCTCKDAGRLIITLIKWQPRMKSWNLTGVRTYWKVIAWMPLPEPYKE